MRPAEVNEIIRAIAARRAADPDALPPLVGCFLSPGWSAGLAFDIEARAWCDLDPDPDHGQGMVVAVVAREGRYDKVSVTGYLVDTYCLGVKDALGPRTMEPQKYQAFLQRFFRAFQGAYVSVSIELARSLVNGAVHYARRLGLEPDADFAAAAAHLGGSPGPTMITFGDRGRPHYISGPHDDAERVIETLRHTLGNGNFEVTILSGPNTRHRLPVFP
jgi:hypothetical protein